MKIRGRKTRARDLKTKFLPFSTLPPIKKGSWTFAGHLETTGGQYSSLWDAKMDGRLQEGAVIRFVREPNNVHDKCAIAVYADKHRIGYVPRENYLLSSIMDIGVNVAGRVLMQVQDGVKVRLYVGVPKK